MANGKCITNGSDPLKYRIVLMGQGRVGKTAILKRFLDDEFLEKYKETVDDLQTKTFDINGMLIKADILDTAGNLSFPAMRRLNIGTAQAFILVYAVDSSSSFDEIQRIFQEIQDIRGQASMNSLPVVVVCNKIDLDPTLWQVHKLDVEEFMLSRTLDCNVAHIEASAKFDTNVREIFVELVKLSRILAADVVAPAEAQNLANGQQRKAAFKQPQRRFSLQTHNSLASFPLSALSTVNHQQQQNQVTHSAGASPQRRQSTICASGDGADQIKTQMQALQLEKGRRKGSLPLVKHKSLSRQSSKSGLKRQKSRNGEHDNAPECYVQ